MTDTMTRPEYATPPTEPPLMPPPTEPPPPMPPRRPRRFVGIAALVALAGVAGTTGGLVADHYLTGTAVTPAAATPATTTTVTRTNDALATVAAKVSPSIVTVLIDSARESALGSGVILNSSGLILTNNHVISS